MGNETTIDIGYSSLLWSRKTKDGRIVQHEDIILDKEGKEVDAKALLKAETTDGRYLPLENYFKAAQRLKKEGYKIVPECDRSDKSTCVEYCNDGYDHLGHKSYFTLEDGTKSISKRANGISYEVKQYPNTQKWVLRFFQMPGLLINGGEVTSISPESFDDEIFAKVPKKFHAQIEEAIKRFGESLTKFKWESALEKLTR